MCDKLLLVDAEVLRGGCRKRGLGAACAEPGLDEGEVMLGELCREPMELEEDMSLARTFSEVGVNSKVVCEDIGLEVSGGLWDWNLRA